MDILYICNITKQWSLIDKSCNILLMYYYLSYISINVSGCAYIILTLYKVYMLLWYLLYYTLRCVIYSICLSVVNIIIKVLLIRIILMNYNYISHYKSSLLINWTDLVFLSDILLYLSIRSVCQFSLTTISN